MLRLISVTNASGTALASTNLGVQNSIRYRGYVYMTMVIMVITMMEIMTFIFGMVIQ